MTKTVVFSSAQDPRSWDPQHDFGAQAVITCMTNADAKKAEELYNTLLARAEKAEAALAARPEEGTIMPDEPTPKMLRDFWIAMGGDPEKMDKLVPLVGSGTGDLQFVSTWENSSVVFKLREAYKAMLAAARHGMNEEQGWP